jgi:hypothetical protein
MSGSRRSILTRVEGNRVRGRLAVLFLFLALTAEPVAIDQAERVETPSGPGRAWILPPTGDGVRCARVTTRVDRPVAPTRDLSLRSDGEAVGHYLLLDRSVNGCPAPLIVNHRVTGSNAVGRVLGDERPVRLPSD